MTLHSFFAEPRWGWLARGALGLLVALVGTSAHAAEALPAAQDPALEARMQAITAELRCLVCQNQTIADSHAELAQDLRQQVRELLQQGKSEQEIRTYMTARYGDFILYRPPLNRNTFLLWAAPALLMVVGVGALVVVLRRRNRLPDEQFDPEAPAQASSAGGTNDPHLS